MIVKDRRNPASVETACVSQNVMPGIDTTKVHAARVSVFQVPFLKYVVGSILDHGSVWDTFLLNPKHASEQISAQRRTNHATLDKGKSMKTFLIVLVAFFVRASSKNNDGKSEKHVQRRQNGKANNVSEIKLI